MMRREMTIDSGSRPDRSLDVTVATPDADGLPPVRLSITKGAWFLQTYLTPAECYEFSAILTACAMEVGLAEEAEAEAIADEEEAGRIAAVEDAAEAEADARKLDERLGFDG